MYEKCDKICTKYEINVGESIPHSFNISNKQAFILFTIPRVQHSLKIALFLPVSEILPFFIFRINRRWPPKFEKKIEFFGVATKYSYYP